LKKTIAGLMSIFYQKFINRKLHHLPAHFYAGMDFAPHEPLLFLNAIVIKK
jgi:hypothetical protein